MDYITELKIAVVNKDIKKMEELSDIIFKSDDMAQLQEAAAMVKEAIKILETQRASTLQNMNNLQKMKQYASQNQNKDLL